MYAGEILKTAQSRAVYYRSLAGRSRRAYVREAAREACAKLEEGKLYTSGDITNLAEPRIPGRFGRDTIGPLSREFGLVDLGDNKCKHIVFLKVPRNTKKSTGSLKIPKGLVKRLKETTYSDIPSYELDNNRLGDVTRLDGVARWKVCAEGITKLGYCVYPHEYFRERFASGDRTSELGDLFVRETGLPIAKYDGNSIAIYDPHRLVRIHRLYPSTERLMKEAEEKQTKE
jgi:hypothetical protein